MSFTRHRYTDDPKKLAQIPDEDMVATRKFDGACYFMAVDNLGKPAFTSRRESVKGGFPDKTNRVPHLAEIHLPEYKDHVFQVELIHTGHNLDSNESHPQVSGILNSLPARAVEQQQLYGPIRAVLTDVIHPSLGTYGEKLELMQRVARAAGKPDQFFAPEAKITKTEMEKLLLTTGHHGQEGIIVTSLTAPEDKNVRIKIKHSKMANLRVKALTQEIDISGKPKNSTGAFLVEDATGKEVAAVGTGLDRETRIQSWQNKDAWIGKLIQVKYLDSVGTRLRHPVYNGEADGEIDSV
jgi:hypothetical protein